MNFFSFYTPLPAFVRLPPLNSGETLYAGVGGLMIFTRDDDWKEVKTGKILKPPDCIDPTAQNYSSGRFQ